ncbi:hypothetical protein GGS21DRAFT_190620 [Xylaria nigripes]|nr:hypothetical protein GGS21DRAFT_190620 [Xylaria nigripes]
MSDILSPPQLDALLDILVHHETYAEVQSFRNPEAIESYGWPFVSRDDRGWPVEPHRPSSSPMLQLLLTRLLLHAPAVRDLSTDFWPVTFKEIMRKFGDADLSDSYDKGTLGTRKRLATAASVVHEALTRGLLSGVSHATLPDLSCPYDREKTEDLTKAWHDCVCQIVYGDLVDQIFDQLTQTDDLEAHSPALKGAVEYAQLHIAAFLHQVFIISAEGPYLLRIIENVHRLVPYTVISQTLRVGNAATMINAISRLFLSKVSLGTISNWIGLTSSPADGMNLMQSSRIISLVLEWDTTGFRKAADKIGLDLGKLAHEQMAAIDRHLASGHKQSELVRQRSIQEQTSIIVAIFNTENTELLASLTDRQHTLCLEYYAAKLAIRDREHITDVLCNSTPDLTTAIVLEGLRVLDPMIRVVHKNVDLRKHLSAIESFLTDFVKTTKPKARNGSSSLTAPSIKDFFELLQRNRSSLWTYLHHFCSRCPDLKNTWRGWMNDTIKYFRQKPPVDIPDKTAPKDEDCGTTNAGDIRSRLEAAFSLLSDTQRRTALKQIDAHSKYLTSLVGQSRLKMQVIIDDVNRKTDTATSVPGVYASRWQSLLDDTLITPALLRGPPRRGMDVRDFKATRKPERREDSDDSATVETVPSSQEEPSLSAPIVSGVIDALGSQFKEMVIDIAQRGLPKWVERSAVNFTEANAN